MIEIKMDSRDKKKLLCFSVDIVLGKIIEQATNIKLTKFTEFVECLREINRITQLTKAAKGCRNMHGTIVEQVKNMEALWKKYVTLDTFDQEEMDLYHQRVNQKISHEERQRAIAGVARFLNMTDRQRLVYKCDPLFWFQEREKYMEIETAREMVKATNERFKQMATKSHKDHCAFVHYIIEQNYTLSHRQKTAMVESYEQLEPKNINIYTREWGTFLNTLAWFRSNRLYQSVGLRGNITVQGGRPSDAIPFSDKAEVYTKKALEYFVSHNNKFKWWNEIETTPEGISLLEEDCERAYDPYAFSPAVGRGVRCLDAGRVHGAIVCHLSSVLLRDLHIIEDFHVRTAKWCECNVVKKDAQEGLLDIEKDPSDLDIDRGEYDDHDNPSMYNFPVDIPRNQDNDEYRLTYNIKGKNTHRTIRWVRTRRADGKWILAMKEKTCRGRSTTHRQAQALFGP